MNPTDSGSPNLTPDGWQRVDLLFNDAIELSAEGRDQLLDREGADNPEVAALVRRMLGACPTATERVARTIASALESAKPADEWLGRSFGPYRVVREIGRGGMGLVFEAERDDDEYRKRVAVKVAPWWRGTMLQERFRVERQILADLEHPHIARFLDGGTADGVPYFVMEYVEGLPLTEYCRSRALDLRARLTLFRQVCGAVAFAHENLVVHRDLKPANILVDDAGEPRLLDFGIARLADQAFDTAATSEMIWTPDYASPEQIRGRAITIRTDVYSLGLILYELLTDERAQSGDVSSPAALERSVCDVEPVAPSTRVSARGDRAGARRLRGDLDTIVLKAIRKEPGRRYDSAAALSDDVGRHLEGRPILARAGTFGYQTTRFLWRHRKAAFAAAIIVLSVAAGLVATLHQARRAERRFNQLRALANAFVFDVHDRIEMLPGSTEARRAIVQTGLSYLESLRADVGGDRKLAIELAAAYEKLGNAQGYPLKANLGDVAGALSSYSRAQELLEPGAASGDRTARRQLVWVLLRIATIRRAEGRMDAAEPVYVRARNMADALLAEEPENEETLVVAGAAHHDLSRAAWDLGNHVASEAGARRAMEIARTLTTLEPASHEHRDHLASAQTSLGMSQISTGHLEEAAASFRETIVNREALVSAEPNNAQYRRQLLISYGHLGDVLGFRVGESLGDTAGAAAAFTRAVELARWAQEHDPSDRRAEFDLANGKVRLGAMLLAGGAPPDALRELADAERLIQSLMANGPRNDRYAHVESVVQARIGDAYAALGNGAEAVKRLDAARSSAIPLLSGTLAFTARQHFVQTTVKLAHLKARAGGHDAARLADEMRAELRKKPLGGEMLEALIYQELGLTFHEISNRTSESARAAAQQSAADALETAAARWHSAMLPPALESTRAAQLATVEKVLAEISER